MLSLPPMFPSRFRRRRVDKAFGRIPKGQDSPFGDFPEEYDRPKPLAPLSARAKSSPQKERSKEKVATNG